MIVVMNGGQMDMEREHGEGHNGDNEEVMEMKLRI